MAPVTADIRAFFGARGARATRSNTRRQTNSEDQGIIFTSAGDTATDTAAAVAVDEPVGSMDETSGSAGEEQERQAGEQEQGEEPITVYASTSTTSAGHEDLSFSEEPVLTTDLSRGQQQETMHHDSVADIADDPQGDRPPPSELEARRAATMARNAALLEALGVKQAADKMQEINAQQQQRPPLGSSSKRRRTSSGNASNARAGAEGSGPVRRSRRTRGEAPGGDGGEKASGEALLERDDPDEVHAKPAEEFFSAEVQAKAIVTDGHFQGWVDAEVCKKHGIAASADDAWNSGGAGTAWSRKNPMGLQSASAVAAASKLSARESSAKMFKKNPNAYFYRHVAPDESQAMDQEWDQSEIDTFLRVAKEHGCGDKWGLFSSYIPRRVGYQCSNFYRSYILPKGLVFDPNYRFTESGLAIYVGRKGSGRG